jgi:hypothetical protein
MRFIGNAPVDGEVRAIASGALATGDTVIVNNDGTVSVVAEAPVSQSVGTSAVFESGVPEFVSAAFDSNANKVVICYKDDGNSNYGTAVIGTVSGTSISFGTPVIFHNDQTRSIAVIFDSNSNKVIIAYRDDNNDGDPAAIVGTVSGTSISFGSPVFISNDQSVTESIGLTFDSTENKVIFVYANAYNSNYGTAVVGTVSGTSISFGTAVVYNSGSTIHNYAVYDTNAQKVVVVYRDSSNSGYGTAVVGTVSGTSISFGSEVVYHAVSTSDNEAVYDPDSQKVVAVHTDASNSNHGTAVVGTVSGTSITFGSPVVFQNSTITHLAVTYDENAKKVTVAYKGPSNYGTMAAGTVSGTSITFDASSTFNPARSEQIGATYDSNAQKVVFAYQDRTGSTLGAGVVVQNAYTSTNLTAENYIGIANSGYASGQSAALNSTCSVDKNQSGLTAGETYYVQTDGTLGTTPANPSVVAGTAISSNSIIVKG